jgi:hypothetical protein
MGYLIARPVLVAIVAAAKPLLKGNGLGDAFVEDVTVGGDAVAGMRRFHLEARGLRRSAAPRIARSFVEVRCMLTVDYKGAKDRGAIDAAIGSDFEVITAELLDQAKWKGATSTIRVVGAAIDSSPDAPLFESVVEDVLVGGSFAGRRLRIAFPIEVST